MIAVNRWDRNTRSEASKISFLEFYGSSIVENLLSYQRLLEQFVLMFEFQYKKNFLDSQCCAMRFTTSEAICRRICNNPTIVAFPGSPTLFSISGRSLQKTPLIRSAGAIFVFRWKPFFRLPASLVCLIVSRPSFECFQAAPPRAGFSLCATFYSIQSTSRAEHAVECEFLLSKNERRKK